MKLIPGKDGLFGVVTKFNPEFNAIAKTVPGVNWNPLHKIWCGYSDAVELLVERCAESGLRLSNTQLLADVHDVGDPLVPIAEKALRDYQRHAVRFLLDRRRCILADAMGLGKTCTALTAARARNGATLIICPSYVRGVWYNEATGGEIKKWWDRAIKEGIWMPRGTKAAMALDAPFKIAVIHYDILDAWADTLSSIPWECVIIDEGHALMNESSQRSKAAKAITADVPYVWLLSGTPLTNRPRDLWNVVDTVCPGRFGAFFKYGLRYCNGHQENVTPSKAVWKFDGSSNLEELNSRLKHFMLRRTVKDVALELPPKTRQLVPIDVPAKAQVMPDAGAKAIRASLDRAADAKMPEAARLIQEHIESGHRVVAFTWRRSVAEFLVDEMRGHGLASEVIHGGVSTLKRGLAIERAKAASSGLLAATIDSSSTGIDLSYADVAVFVEITYEPQELLQAEARLHRFGQRKPVLIQYIVARGTTDELIASVVISKLDVYEKAIGSTGESLGDDLRGNPDDIMSELYAAIEKQKLPPKKKAREPLIIQTPTLLQRLDREKKKASKK